MRWLSTAVVIALASFSAGDPATAQDASTTASGHPPTRIVQLRTGDSLELQATGPALVHGGPTGVLVTYHPFAQFSDTAKLHSMALEFFRTLRPQLDSVASPFAVLRAVNRRAVERNQTGFYGMQAFGVVFEHRRDGKWYVLHEREPVAE